FRCIVFLFRFLNSSQKIFGLFAVHFAASGNRIPTPAVAMQSSSSGSITRSHPAAFGNRHIWLKRKDGCNLIFHHSFHSFLFFFRTRAKMRSHLWCFCVESPRLPPKV